MKKIILDITRLKMSLHTDVGSLSKYLSKEFNVEEEKVKGILEKYIEHITRTPPIKKRKINMTPPPAPKKFGKFFTGDSNRYME
jgi:hypothetical protein